jgi:hypothetical protein
MRVKNATVFWIVSGFGALPGRDGNNSSALRRRTEKIGMIPTFLHREGESDSA